MERIFTEFSESDQSLKQELGSRSSLLPMSYWHNGSICFSYIRDNSFEYCNLLIFNFSWSSNLLNSLKTFRENSTFLSN